MKVKDINMNKIKVPKKCQSVPYKISPQTSEPADIFRAALRNRSFCLFIFNFLYLLSNLILGKLGRIKQLVHTFDHQNIHVYIISIGIPMAMLADDL